MTTGPEPATDLFGRRRIAVTRTAGRQLEDDVYDHLVLRPTGLGGDTEPVAAISGCSGHTARGWGVMA